MLKRVIAFFVLLLAVPFCFAATITVTTPAKGTPADPTLVDDSTPISFTLKNMAQSEAKIQITVRRNSDNSIFFQNLDALRVTPGTTNDDGSGTFSLTFSEGTPEVVYKVEVRAVPVQTGVTTYNDDQDLYVKPDLTKPKFLSYTPSDSAFIKGIVKIKVKIQEANLKDWRVQIDNQDIPNNQGTTVDANGYFQVSWDTTGIKLDGSKTINLRVRDSAGNEQSKSINVTLDRVPPIITIKSPLNNTHYSPGTNITVTVDIKDASSASTSANGVDVIARRMDGSFIVRAAKIQFQQVDGVTNRWTGRIRWVQGQLPSKFKIEVTAYDKAGNAGTKQTVIVYIG